MSTPRKPDVGNKIVSPMSANSTQSTETDLIDPDELGTTEPEAESKACTPGISVGYMMIRKPNITSVVYTGSLYNVSWDYSVTVNNPPKYVDVYIQSIASGLRTTWKNKIAENISTARQHFFWEPKSLADGKYKLRLVPDGKETFNVPADKLPCFGDGESVPSVSATFKVFSPKGSFIEYPEQFPASSLGFSVGASNIHINLLAGMVIILWCFYKL